MNKQYIKLAIGIAISAVAIWLAFHWGGVTWAQIVDAFRKTNWLYAIPMMALTMVSFYWRCFRWKILLAPVQDVPARRLFGPLMIGFAFNNIFPARAGEIARPIALTKQEKVPLGPGFSTIVVERLIDVLTLLILMIAMPLYVKLDPSYSSKIPGTSIEFSAQFIESKMPVLSIMAGILFLGIGTFLVPPIRAAYIRVIHAMRFLPENFRTRITEFIESFARGFDSLKSVKAVLLVVLHSAIIWGSVALSFQLMSLGFPGVSMSYGQALAFLVATCLVISIPSSPGFWGLYEFGGMAAIVMMGVVPNTDAGTSAAFAFALIVHFLQWLPITAYGLWWAGKLSISSDLKTVDAMEETAEHVIHPDAAP